MVRPRYSSTSSELSSNVSSLQIPSRVKKGGPTDSERLLLLLAHLTMCRECTIPPSCYKHHHPEHTESVDKAEALPG